MDQREGEFALVEVFVEVRGVLWYVGRHEALIVVTDLEVATEEGHEYVDLRASICGRG